MKREFFLKAIGGIDDDLICEANAENERRRVPWRTFGGIAAAIVVACGVWTAIEMGGLDAHTKAESAPDAICPTDGDVMNASGGKGDYYYTADDGADTEIAYDTSNDLVQVPDTTAWFFFCKGGVWSEEVRTYQDGVPDAVQLANEYLTAIGAQAKCTSVRVETVGATDRVEGDIVSHDVGVRTAHVTLVGVLTDDELRGFVATIGNRTAAHFVRPVTAEGKVIPIDGTAPDEGYSVHAWRK